MRWPLTFYTDRFLPDWSGGRAIGPVILLRPKYKGTDPGIHAHEFEHVKQWFKTLGLLGLIYLHPAGRLWAEVQAYKVQLRTNAAHGWRNGYDYTRRYAEAIASKYRIKITADKAEKLLREG